MPKFKAFYIFKNRPGQHPFIHGLVILDYFRGVGVLECWSNGRKRYCLFTTLQYSITPVPHDQWTLGPQVISGLPYYWL